MFRRFSKAAPASPDGGVVPLSSTHPTSLVEQPSSSDLGKRTTSGFVWLMVQTVLSKLFSIIGQLITARLLAPDDFGVFGLAYAATLAFGLVQEAGIRDILVRLHHRFERWANAAFWLSLGLCVGGYALMWTLAPLIERFYGMPQLALLIRVAGVSPSINVLANVPKAKLESEMRFRLLAQSNFWTLIAINALTIVFALLKMGALSFVLPFAIVSLAKCAWFFALVRPPVKWNLDRRRWRFLLGDMGFLMVTGGCNFVLWQGDYMILGRMVSKDELGLYFFAYTLAQQTFLVLSANINSVLLPALSQLQNDPPRQLRAYRRAFEALVVAAAFLCLLPAILSPAITSFFGAKWLACAPILAVLNLGMAVRVADASSEALLKAQGRFQTLTIISVAHAIFFAIAGVLGAYYGGALGMAWAVAVGIACFGPLRIFLGVRALRGNAGQIWKPFALFFSLFGVSQVVPLVLSHVVFHDSPAWTVLLSLGIGTPLYVLLLRTFAPDVWNDLSSRLKRKRA